MEVPLRRPVRDVHGVTAVQRSVLVRVATGESVEGWGDVDPTPGYSRLSVEDIQEAVRRLGPALLGLDPFNVRAALTVMDGCIDGQSEAKAAVEMALCDLKARALRRAAGDHRVHHGRDVGTAVSRVETRQHEDRQQDVHRDPGEHDHETGPQGLRLEPAVLRDGPGTEGNHRVGIPVPASAGGFGVDLARDCLGVAGADGLHPLHGGLLAPALEERRGFVLARGHADVPA